MLFYLWASSPHYVRNIMRNFVIFVLFSVLILLSGCIDDKEVLPEAVDVPDEVVQRMSGVPKEKQPEEGINICVETIQRLKEVEGLHCISNDLT